MCIFSALKPILCVTGLIPIISVLLNPDTPPPPLHTHSNYDKQWVYGKNGKEWSLLRMRMENAFLT